jgi:hypothetical protein
LASGLPDGLFSNQKSQFGKKFQGLGLESLDIFMDKLRYFMTIWYFVCLFGTVFRLWKKNLATLVGILLTSVHHHQTVGAFWPHQ